ncbi:hypothetical protein V8C86DRAFT_2491886 [Haematococcus lacustris]
MLTCSSLQAVPSLWHCPVSTLSGLQASDTWMCRLRKQLVRVLPETHPTPSVTVITVTTSSQPGISTSPSSQQESTVTSQLSPPPPPPPSPHPPSSPHPSPPLPATHAASKYQPVSTGATQDVELPRDAEDIERILRYPYHEDCNLCTVCIPQHVVAHHPKAQAVIRERGQPVVLSEDPDVSVNQFSPAETARRKQQSTSRSQHRQGIRQRSLHAATAQPGGRSQAAVERQHLQPQVEGLDLAGQSQFQPAFPDPEDGGSGAGSVQPDGSNRPGMQASSDSQTAAGGRQQGSQQRRLLTDTETRDEVESDGIYRIRGKSIDISDIAPGNTKAPARKRLRNCTVCWGCQQTLELMASGTTMAGSYYSHEPGGSPSWLFRVRTNKTTSGWAVVKVWCVPVMKVKQRGFAMCSQRKVYSQVKLLLAQNKVASECGLLDIAPRTWVEPVHGVIPGHGFRIDWLGLWADIADGVSVQNIQEAGKPPTPPHLILDLFTNRLNHTEVKMAALFDLLFSQCDRHQQNIFLTEKGKLWVIDNDQVHTTAWRRCGIDSMLLPTTQKFMINHLGFFYVLKYPQKDPPQTWTKNPNPLVLLDYRCHVEGGAIGKRFFPKLEQCMRHIGSMQAAEIQALYGYPNIRMSDAIRNRSTDMLSKGYEWTLLYGQPTNQAMHRYKIAPPCCAMHLVGKERRYTCNTSWVQMGQLPYGNPWHGGDWHGTPGRDTGSYVGGTVF